ncbi:MAG TPA: glycosyltransferase [Verrucomicrobiae bacterium]|nr:glycosyltransferase [Verrucomicrobiae bacterium]
MSTGSRDRRAFSRTFVDGKFFRAGEAKFFVKGVSYGPFARDASNHPLPPREQVDRDFGLIAKMNANTVRVYHPPPEWFLDLASEHGLRVLVDITWPKHLCFLESTRLQREAREAVREVVAANKAHPAVFAYNMANEIPADIVRWSGERRVNRFIESLVEEAKNADPEALCTFVSFPPTEFLRPENIDFLSFNVYLHQRKAFESYLARLQMLADSKPLVLSEFGFDSIREGEERKSEMLAWQIEAAFRAGLAGTVLFSFTDDWVHSGHVIEDWAFGVTTRDRSPKGSFAVVQHAYQQAPHFALARRPKVSVVVATYNGARTLKSCLDSLTRLNYPDYEVIVVDDGSTDATPEIAQRYSQFHYLRQANHGLSVARNSGIAASRGEIVAFTDSDCRADEDWLNYLVADLLSHEFHGIGGHNFLPPDDSWVAAAVMASPGGPAHVMLTDRDAEHVPGCNMAFYKWVLEDAGGFDPVFRKAGDDVDMCWRLLERGRRIGFSAAGFVWHYRRSNVAAYLKQQSGYGEAEALLAHKHPEYFNAFGVGVWRGRIYGSSKYGVIIQRPVIYHGLFGSGFFQKLYSPEPAHLLMLLTSLEYHGLVTGPLLILSFPFPFLLPIGIASLALSLGVCVAAAAQADVPRKKRRLRSRPLITLLFLLQPMVRGWARYRWRFNAQSAPKRRMPKTAVAPPVSDHLLYWSKRGFDRYKLLSRLLERLDDDGWENKPDTGWGKCDLEIYGNRWSRLRLTTVSEELDNGYTLRCRIENTWSLRATLGFWMLAALELVMIGLFARFQPWFWMMLLSLPILSWFLEFEKRATQMQVTAVLDEVAAEFELTRVQDSVKKPEAQSACETSPSYSS